MQITYQKKDGTIIYRLRNTLLPYKIGDITSMGWKVLNIEYKYKDKFYPEYKYNILIQKNKHLAIRRQHTKELIVGKFKTFLYCFIVILVLSFFKRILGI